MKYQEKVLSLVRGKGNFAFFIYIGIVFFYYSWTYSNLEFLKNDLLVILASPFLLIKLLDSDFTKKEFFINTVLVICGILSYLFSGEVAFALFVSVLIGLKNVDLKKVLQIMFYVYLLSFLLIIAFGALGIIENIQVVHNRFGMEMNRNSMGFGHPNAMGLRFFSLVCIYFMCIWNQKVLSIKLVFLANLLQFIINGSRTSFIAVIFLLVILYLVYFQKKIDISFLMKTFRYIFPICFIIVLFIFLFYDTSFIQKINELLMYRFSYVKLYLDSIGISWLGNNVDEFTLGVTLDMGWANLILRLGLILSLSLTLAYYALCKKIYSRQMYSELCIIFCVCIYAFSENILYSLAFNPSLLLLIFLLYNNSVNLYESSRRKL